MRRSIRQIKIQHPVAHQLYSYHLGQRFDPGAQAEIFIPLNSNPVQSFRGPARLAGMLNVFQPSQLNVPMMVRTNGIGGIQAGQIISQPLIVPDGETGS